MVSGGKKRTGPVLSVRVRLGNAGPMLDLRPRDQKSAPLKPPRGHFGDSAAALLPQLIVLPPKFRIAPRYCIFPLWERAALPVDAGSLRRGFLSADAVALSREVFPPGGKPLTRYRIFDTTAASPTRGEADRPCGAVVPATSPRRSKPSAWRPRPRRIRSCRRAAARRRQRGCRS